jgi:hypothetical protein
MPQRRVPRFGEDIFGVDPRDATAGAPRRRGGILGTAPEAVHHTPPASASRRRARTRSAHHLAMRSEFIARKYREGGVLA